MNFLDAAGLARFFAGLGAKFAALSHTHGTADIEDGAITTAKIANMAVTTSKLGNKSVTTSKLGNKCVANGNLGDMSVQEGKIFPQAVTTTKIRDGAVTEDKLDATVRSMLGTVLYTAPNGVPVALASGDHITTDADMSDVDPKRLEIVYSLGPDGESTRKAQLVITQNKYWTMHTFLTYYRGTLPTTTLVLFKIQFVAYVGADWVEANFQAYYPSINGSDIVWTRVQDFTPQTYIWKITGYAS